MFLLKSVFVFIVIFITFINADDGGLSDIPFDGTPDDVEDAFRTKMAVNLAEKGKISVLNKKTLAEAIGVKGIGGMGTGLGNTRAVEMNSAFGGPFGEGTAAASSGKTGGSDTYSSVYHAGK